MKRPRFPSNPKVSVIIPVHNTEEYIGPCLTSLKHQTFSEFEAFVIDDLSTDRSFDKATKLIKEDSRFTIIRHDSNRGPSVARNTGIRAARGRYIYFVDGDDILAPYAIEKLVEQADTDGADVTVCNGRVHHSGRLIRKRPGQHKGPISFKDEPALWSGGGVFLFLFERRFLEGVGGFFQEGIHIGEDQIYLAKVLPHAERISFVSETCYYYRRGSGISNLGEWPLEKWFQFAEYITTVSSCLRPYKVAWNYNLLAQVVFRLKFIVASGNQINSSVYDEILDRFVNAHRGLEFEWATNPNRQPWRPLISLPRQLHRLLFLLAEGTTPGVRAELKRLSFDFLDPLITLSEQALARGNANEALRLAKLAVRQNPRHIMAWHHLATLRARMKLFREAEAAEKRALHMSPLLAASQLHISQLLRRRNQTEAAIDHARKALQLDQHNPAAHVHLGQCLLDTNDAEGAARCHEAASSLDPEFPQVFALLSRIESVKNRLDEAVALAAKAVELDPDNLSFHQTHADLLLKEGRTEEALESTRRAVQFDPGNAELQHHLGNLLQKVDRLSEAETAYRRAIELKPQLVGAHKQLSTIFAQQTRWQEALQSATRAVECDPENAKLHHHLGNLLQKAGRVSEAESALRRAIEINPNLVGAYKQLSIILSRRRCPEESLQLARRAVELEPDNAGLQHHLGNLLQKLGFLAEAEDAYRRALELTPALTVAHKQLSAILASQGRQAEAEQSASGTG